MAHWFFESDEALYAGLRLCDSPEAWLQPTTRRRLEADERPTAWLLQTDAALPDLCAVSPSEEDGWIRLDRAAAASRYRAAESERFGSLFEAVPLRPRTATATGVFYVELDSVGRFHDAARANLMLGNDQMRYLPLGDGRVLLRVENLSAFLSEKWRESEGVTLYRPATAEARVLVPEGWDHPLADKLHLLGGDEGELWLIRGNHRWVRLRAPMADIYEKVEIDGARLNLEAVDGGEEIPPLTVELRLEPTEAREPAQLWWLADHELPAIERLLAEATEAELNQLQLAVVSPAEGQRAYLILERGGLGSSAPSIHGGEAYYGRLPVEHLYLPVGQRLAPLLSRRSLIESLGLGEDHLTLVSAAGAELRVTRVPRELLRPVTDLVDYLVAGAASEVEALLEQVRFDFDLAPVEPEADEAPAAEAKRGWWSRLGAWLGGKPREGETSRRRS